jgi:ATP-binding cassette subfamily B protein/subfamily B ATP-binding cassette protein MsbA
MLSASLSLAGAVLMLALPALGGRMLAAVIGHEAIGTRGLVAIIVTLLIGLAFVNFTTAYVSGAAAARLLAELRLRVYAHLQSLPISFHEDHRQGDTLALMTYEVSRLSSFLTDTLTQLPARLVTVAGVVVLMFRIDPHLALAIPILVPLFYLVLKIVGRRLRGLARALQEAEADMVAAAEENLAMLPVIKAFTREDTTLEHYRARLGAVMALTIQEHRLLAVLEPTIGLIAAVVSVLVLYSAGQSVAAGSLSPTGLFSLLFYAALLTRPVGALAQVYGQVQSSMGTLARLQAVLRLAPEQGYRTSEAMMRATGAISFEQVHFAHPGRPTLLRGLDLQIAPGEIVALTGPNGAGKTTLINLLLGYYAPERGRICLDGIDVATLDVQCLRQQVGLVPQRAFLINGTIRDNIVFGRADASPDDIERAARLAEAWEFIAALPHGLDTVIGDNGVRLSGGQRQRLALARALIKDPPILVLDEATSMYDIPGELAFVESCATALAGRTVLIITHRPASLAMADRVLSISNGVIQAEAGSPGHVKAATR